MPEKITRHTARETVMEGSVGATAIKRRPNIRASKAKARREKPAARVPINRTLRTCKGCGCADARACLGGCFWVGEDLCSKCVGYGRR